MYSLQIQCNHVCIVIVWIFGETPFSGLRNLWTILHLHNCICGERYIIPGPDQVKKTPEILALKKDIVFLSVLMLQAILVKKYAIVEI